MATALWAVRLPAVTITSIEVADARYADPAALSAAASAALSGSYAFIIPRASTFFFSRSEIGEELRVRFPSVTDVAIARNGLTALALSVVEREPAARGCREGGCFLMDAEGVLFAYAGSGDQAWLTYRGASAGELGNTYLGGGFPALHALVGTLSSSTGRTPASVSVDEHDDVTVRFAEGGEIRFVREADQAALLENISSTFVSRKFKDREAFEYADFRFGNSVYVKWK